MHYVSWDRTDRDAPVLLAEAGPEVLGRFTADRAVVGTETWELTSHPESGAVATRDGAEIIRANGPLKRAQQVDVEIEGQRYTLVPETSKEWIVDDAAGNKVAQFTQDHNGVRKAILEFEGDTDLPLTHIAGLAWISREVLEARKMVSSTSLIALLGFLSVFIVIVVLL